ncbi:MAG: CHAT domain-containing protein [Cyanobacteria bacterium P01_G01_bin.39]
MFKHINRLTSRLIYFLMAMTVAIAIIVTETYFHPSQSSLSAQSVPSPKEELVDVIKFSDTIDKLESKWENDYEGYFDRDFDNQSRSARQIANRLKEVREQTEINPAVIWAIPKQDFLQLILVTPDRQFVSRKVPGANRARLEKRLEELETAIKDRRSLKYLPPARLIYSWVFRPLEPYLEAEQIDTLLLCTGPKLRSLPFAALHDGDQFVVEKYNLARIPAFNLTDTSYENVSGKTVLAMGASEFEQLPSLPGVKTELDTIVPTLWPGQKIYNQNFTVENLIQAHQVGNFDIVHIASHSDFNSGSPENSYIQFSDRKLSLDQLSELNLDTPQVDLLVLSACQTAIGNEDAEYGFAGLAMQAGVKSALASLWSVDDAGTVLLMSNFYEELQSTAIKSAALRQAQVNLLSQQVFVDGAQVRGLDVEVELPFSGTEDENYSHPFYWAGFTIIGNPW